MAAKEYYSENVQARLAELASSAYLNHAWEAARKEKERYSGQWATVNINRIVDPNFDLSSVRINARKMFFPSIYPGITVVADIAGGYLCLTDDGKHFYSIEGKLINEVSKKKLRRLAHYRILKKEEMEA